MQHKLHFFSVLLIFLCSRAKANGRRRGLFGFIVGFALLYFFHFAEIISSAPSATWIGRMSSLPNCDSWQQFPDYKIWCICRTISTTNKSVSRIPLYRLIYGYLQEDTHFVAFGEWQKVRHVVWTEATEKCISEILAVLSRPEHGENYIAISVSLACAHTSTLYCRSIFFPHLKITIYLCWRTSRFAGFSPTAGTKLMKLWTLPLSLQP